MFSRVLYGARISLSVGLVGIFFTFVFGMILGGLSGYLGGIVDAIIQRLVDLLISIPTIPLWMALAAALPRDWPPVRAVQEVAPVSIWRAPSGETLVDFGQNLVGRVRIRLAAEPGTEVPAGTEVTVRHAEVLENGELGVRPLRSAQATDRYLAHGGGPEEWEPRFTFHGFRYAGVSGWPGELRPDDITAVVLHSDMMRTGWFECSEPQVNQFHENIVWACAATSWTCRPTARSATSGSAGPATSRCSPPPPPCSTTPPRC